MPNEKICPLMNKPDSRLRNPIFVNCQKEACQLWMGYVGNSANARYTERANCAFAVNAAK